MSDDFTFEDDSPAPDVVKNGGGVSDTFSFTEPKQARGTHSSFFQGANEVITAMAVYAPENAVMSALETVGLVKEGSPRRVTDWMNDKFGLGTADSPAMVDRLARSAGSMVVQNLATISPVYLEAKAAQGVMNPTLMNLIKEQIVGYVQKAPVASLVAETVAAGGGGAGMKAVEELGGGPTAQMAGGIAGAIAPGVAINVAGKMPTSLAVKAAVKLQGKFGKEARTTEAYRAAQAEIKAGMDATGEANLKAANDALMRINMARISAGELPTGGLTIAESTGAQNLIALQHKFEKEATGSVLNGYARRKVALAEGVLLGNAHKPEFTGIEPDVIYDVSRARVDRTVEKIDTQVEDIRRQKSGITGSLPRADDRVNLGTKLREIRENARDVATSKFKQRADEIGLNDYEARFPMADLKDQLTVAMNIKGTRFVEGDLPPSIRDLVNLPNKAEPKGPYILNAEGQPFNRASSEPEPLSWADVELLRKRLTDDMEKAVATPGEGRYVRQLAIARDLFDRHILSVDPVSPTVRPTFGADWKAFRNDYFNEIITRFDQGAAYKTSAAGKTSEYRMLPEKVADAFWSSESSVRDFKRLYGDRPDAMIALRDAVLDKVRDASVRGGEVDTNLLNSWVRKNARQLDEVPVIRDELMNVQSRLSALSAREAQLLTRRTVVEKMALTKALGKSPEEYVRRAIHDEKLMRHIVNTTRRTKTERALKAAVWEEAMRQIETPAGEVPNPDKLMKWAKDNHRSLKMALPGEHLQNIEDIYTILTAVRRMPVPIGSPSNTSPWAKIEGATGTTPSQLSSRWWGMVQGRTSEKVVLLERGITFFDKYTKRQKDALLQEALMNEKLARDIKDMTVDAAKDTVSKSQYRKLNGWLYTLGVTNAVSDKEESE